MPTDPDPADPADPVNTADAAGHGALDDAMAGFRERARATNLARVDVIEEAVHALRDGTLTEPLRISGRGAAHALAGSAGTFGFVRAGELGRSLEALLDEPVAGDDQTSGAGRALEQVTQLREALVTSPAVPGPPEHEDIA